MLLNFNKYGENWYLDLPTLLPTHPATMYMRVLQGWVFHTLY